jgi:hypothetical protein
MEFAAEPQTSRDEIASFLGNIFHVTGNAPIIEPRAMHWKLFDPRPDWEGSRSAVLRRKGEIVAHATMCPMRFLRPEGEVTGIHPVDWAGSPQMPGSGVLLLRYLMRITDTLLGFGGSASTQAILPRLGYRALGDFHFYARVVRPWMQHRTRPQRDGWKTAARLARNTLWSWTPLPRTPAGWAAEPIEDFLSALPPEFWKRIPGAYTPLKRTPELVNYFLRCPIASIRGFHLLHASAPRGYFLLSRAGHQTKIAEIRLSSDSAQDWRAAYITATRTAMDDPSTCEIIAGASTAMGKQTIESLGYRLRERSPLSIYDPKQALADAPPLWIDMMDGDQGYLQDIDHPYYT